MKRVIGSLLAVSLLLSSTAFAQQSPQQDQDRDRGHQQEDRGHGGHGGGKDERHPPKRGERLAEGQRGDRVEDYKRHGLKRPPKGHEWRKVDDRYVLVAVATGLITSVILANNR